MKEVFIPFPGFYESELSDAIDREMEMICEGQSDDDDRVDACRRGQLMYEHADYRKMYLKAAQFYVRRFNEWVQAETENADDLGLVFKEMISPREYNFTTDRVLCGISETTVRFLMDSVSPGTLREQIRKNHTSYDGFHSFYSNVLEDWPADVLDWDCNHVATLLQAWLLDNVNQAERWRQEIMELMYEDWDDCVDAGMDWPAYDAAVAAAAAQPQ